VSWKYQTPELLKMAYDNTLYTKTLLVRFPNLISDFVKRSSNDEIKNKYARLLDMKKNITQKGLSVDSVNTLKERILRLEREIITSVKNPTELFDYSQISCDKVRQSLKRNEVAIEFILIPVFLSGNECETYYGALIERSDLLHPVFVKLCKEKTLNDVLDKHQMMENEFVDSLYSLNNEKLFDLIFHPLEKYIHNGETIFFSPVSGIHKVNLQAIAIGSHQRLMDKYVLVEVSSTAQIIEKSGRKRAMPLSNAFLIGGVDYNEGIEDMSLEASHYSRFFGSESSLATRSTNRGTWDPIPGTLTEAQQIDSILNKNKVSSVLLCGGKANEEAFKSLDGKSPKVIHLSTHGFFYEEKEDATTRYFDNTVSYANKRLPMQYCGILLAGANNAWLGKQLPADVEDGILTAEEISHMDLFGNEITVLSACETGLGKIDDIDGVYGLQRGFKMAGVETIVMSLWKIPDDATKILMVEFYRNLMMGKTKHQSLKEAQSYLRRVQNGKYDKPEYWAAFIMLDGLN
jgi:CHAT domain-containing protein